MSGTVASVRSQHRGGYPRVLAPLRFCDRNKPVPQRHCSCQRASAGIHANGNGRMSGTAAGGGGQHRGGIHGYHSRSPPPTLMLYIFVEVPLLVVLLPKHKVLPLGVLPSCCLRRIRVGF